MMICEDCGSTFENPKRIGKEQPVYSIKSVTEPEEYVCPECGSPSIAEAQKCEECGMPAVAELCPECMRKALEGTKKACEMTRNFFYTSALLCSNRRGAIHEFILRSESKLFKE